MKQPEPIFTPEGRAKMLTLIDEDRRSFYEKLFRLHPSPALVRAADEALIDAVNRSEQQI
jgi:hypothetical protein